jgi:uncharacterized membrane-anchored protein YhcB (DUF1043 family)
MTEEYCEAMQAKIERQIEEYKRCKENVYNQETKQHIAKVLEYLELLYKDYEF